MANEKIYKLHLDICNPNLPFRVERHIGVESGDLTKVLAEFPLRLHQLLKEIHEEELIKLREEYGTDDVPF